MQQVTTGDVIKLQKPNSDNFINVKDFVGDCTECGAKQVNIIDHICQTLIHNPNKMITTISEFKKFHQKTNESQSQSHHLVVAKDKEQLKMLIKKNIEKFGPECDLNYIDVSQITDMKGLFDIFNFNGDISNWDVSNVTDMKCMFECSNFNQDISNWDVSNVIDMECMFYNSNFNQDISNWDVSNVTNMTDIFEGCPLENNPPAWLV